MCSMAASPMPDDQTVTVRRARPDDAAALAALKLATFRETFLEGFAIPYPPEDLARFEAETYSEARILAEIEDMSHASWVCEAADGALLAYAHAGPAKLPHPDVMPDHGELYQIYVRRAAQGMRLGPRLLEAALGWIETRFAGPQWLGVWSGNERAQAFYTAVGFRKVGDYHFMVGDHRDDEFIFRRG